MKILFIINDAPSGSEKPINALRLVHQLGKDHPEIEVEIFLLDNAVTCAIAAQTTPNGYYNIERMLKLAISKGMSVKLCTTCSDARGVKASSLIEGASFSGMTELANLVAASDKVLTF
jgi:uncharacterized protein involved in oxidation of intracellular sulfur